MAVVRVAVMDVEREDACVPSSLDSLAHGWRAVGCCEVSGLYAGVLAPAHDGDFRVFTGNARAALDEAEPMGIREQPVRVRGSSRIQSMGTNTNK
jgi:hypothetical protein